MSTLALTLTPFAPPTTAPADFSEETWWLSLLKALFIVLFLIMSVTVSYTHLTLPTSDLV